MVMTASLRAVRRSKSRLLVASMATKFALPALPFLQRDARTGQAFGSTSLFDIVAAHRTMEVGHTWLGASHRRTAANTEAKRLILGHAFETLGAIRSGNEHVISAQLVNI